MKRSLSLLFLFLPVLLTDGQLNGQQHKLVSNDTTYMLTYDHGGLILWGSDHFMERLRDAAGWLEKYNSFKIGLDNEAFIYDYLGEKEPGLMTELKGYLTRYHGRLGIGSSTYGQPLSQFINDESNVRQFKYALEAEWKYFDYRPPVYLMSEHAMHSQIPQILNGFGYKGAIMRTHFMMYGYNPVFDLPAGLWTGADGSQIAAVPTYPGEGAEFGKTTMDTWILTRYPGSESPLPMEAFRKKFSHIRPLLASRADDSGLRKEELVKEYEKKPKFKWILLDDLLAKYKDISVPMVTGPNDFVVRMPWGYCGNEIWNNSRKAETNLLTAERLATVELMCGGESFEKELDMAWKNLLLAQHHDIQICGLLPDARRLLSGSLEASSDVIRATMGFFAGKLSGQGKSQVTVFNPLSWSRSCWIVADIDISRGMAKGYFAKCGETEIPVRIISPEAAIAGSNIMVKGIFRADLAPLSVASYSILEKENIEDVSSGIISDENRMTVSTPYYIVALAADGGISYIRDIRTGKLVTGGKSKALFFEGTIGGRDTCSSGRWIIQKSTDNDPSVKMVEHGFISDIPYDFEIILYADNPRIDCHVKFDFNGQMIGLLSSDKQDANSPFVHEEKLRLKIFPAMDTSAAGIRDLPFVFAETGNRYVEGNYWTAVSDGVSGMAYFNRGNMGSVRERDGSFSLPLAYSMYYIWGSRILYGEYEYEFAFLPFSGNWKNVDLHRKALEYSFSPQVIRTMPGDGTLGTSVIRTDITGNNDVLLTGLYPENDKVVARFFKAGDSAKLSELSVKLNGEIPSEIKMNGEIIREVADKTVLKPWEVKTFRSR